jgi:hypothetical protein
MPMLLSLPERYRTWIRTGTCAALLLVTWAFPSDAKTTASHFDLKGDTAVATFDIVSASDPCLENFVFIFASDEIQKISPGQKSTTVRASLVVSQVDNCTGIPLLSGEGQPDMQVFRMDRNSATLATLTTTIPVFDFLTFQVYDFDVNLTWRATVPAERHHDHEYFRDRTAGILINTQVRGLHAPAVATGTVFGFGQNFTPEPTTNTELQTDNTGSVTIERTTPVP